ncbi:MAG: response regulator [Defluviitaleaceae bacterium]|nr:response regulator [Defluviitaleaceae bacterium]
MHVDRHCVLIIDDTPIMLRILGDILKADYDILLARDGIQGINLAKTNKPSLILLDVVMPDMSGFEVITVLKTDYETENIPVIFITGLDSAKELERGYQLGATDYIEKPFVEFVVKKRVEFAIKFLEMERKLEQALKACQL